MKTKKFTVNLPSLLLGMGLCLVLVLLIGSKSPAPQTISGTPTNQVESRVANIVKPATLASIYDKTVQLEAKLAAIEEHCKIIEQKQDATYHELYYRLPK